MNEAMELLNFLMQNAGQLSERDLMIGIEKIQDYADALEELIDDLPSYDPRPVIRIDNNPQMLRLHNAAALAKYLTEIDR